MSYLKQVMEMLELEDMQEFEVNENDYTYRFNLKEGYLEYITERTKEWHNCDYSYAWLIEGNITIKREWKPKRGDTYWGINFSAVKNVDYYDYVDDVYDERLYERGLVFETKEEAIECAKKMLEAIK